jgi:hypothetical protein
MGRRHSDTELGAKLAAALTAPAPHAARKRAEAEASRAFDLARARRPESARLLVRPGIRKASTSAPPLLSVSTPSEVRIKPLLVVPVVRPASLYVDAGPSALGPIRRPSIPSQPVNPSQPVYEDRAASRPGAGGFGVVVAWLATISTGALAATALPAHVVMQAHPQLVAAPRHPAAAPRAGTETSAPATPPSRSASISGSLVDPAPAVVVVHAEGPSLPPVQLRSVASPPALSHRLAAPVRPKAAAPAVAREAPPSPDDDNPYAVAPASTAAPEPRASTFEDQTRRGVERESKPRR